MNEKTTWKPAQIRAAAIIAKQQNVVIELRPDGTVVILPELPPAPPAAPADNPWD